MDEGSSSTVSETLPTPLLSIKWVMRLDGSQALSGMTKYEMSAKMVTPAMMIGASRTITMQSVK